MKNYEKGKLLNNCLVSLSKNYFLSKLVTNVNKSVSVLCDEDKLIAQSKIILKSFDITKHNNIVDAKIGLREIKF